jgi:hypothetical protein
MNRHSLCLIASLAVGTVRSRPVHAAPTTVVPQAASTGTTATSAAGSKAPRSFGAFAAYALLDADPFPSGPAACNPLVASSCGTSSSALYSWGYTGLTKAPVIHYLVLWGNPDDSPAELRARSGAPQATLPRDARFVYHGKEWSKRWVFETVAVTGPAVLERADLESCKIVDGDFHDATGGVDAVSKRPWIEIRLKRSGLEKIAALPPRSNLAVTFGDEALSLGWFPGWTDTTWTPPSFAVEGRTDGERRARAAALVAACDAARSSSAP